MKFWEAMKLLEEDPSRKFEYQDDRKKWLLYAEVCYDDLVFYQLDCWDSKGELRTEDAFGSLHDNLTTSDNWQLVKQPVTWQEAIQAWVDGDRVTVEYELPGGIVKHGKPPFGENIGITRNELIQGTWYMED